MAMARYSPQMQFGWYNPPYPGQGTMPMVGYSPQMQPGYNNSPYPGQGTMQMNGYPQNPLFGNYNNPNPVSGNSLMAQGLTPATNIIRKTSTIIIEGDNNTINYQKNAVVRVQI
ncbi:uncharacterized protein LOC128549091 [Mercenaria mercenaria]|uniref:uncharacterized protein LOC128549091 n=1 Tax=Mercenaria mercenaria TaxID=6596 RepID=UPI00234F132D|nr:uncharacterized protein LOC128549091 [Mercenaria mercenaria]